MNPVGIFQIRIRKIEKPEKYQGEFLLKCLSKLFCGKGIF
jgi:hypothetical protein